MELSVASGLNALAHCVDSMWGPRADPINAALAAEGIRALRAGLPAVIDGPAGLAGREQALYGALPRRGRVRLRRAPGMHHKICHVLGGTFNLPHAQTHATVLPYVLAFNAPRRPGRPRPHRRGLRRGPTPSAGLQTAARRPRRAHGP